jgi:hypothetical protein
MRIWRQTKLPCWPRAPKVRGLPPSPLHPPSPSPSLPQGQQVPEAEFLRVLRRGVAEAQALLPPQRALAEAAGRPKRRVALAGADPAAARRVEALARPVIAKILRGEGLGKAARAAALARAKSEVVEELKAAGDMRAVWRLFGGGVGGGVGGGNEGWGWGWGGGGGTGGLVLLLGAVGTA